MLRQTTVPVEDLIKIATDQTAYSGPTSGCCGSGRLPRCAAVNELGIIWSETGDQKVEQVLVDLLADERYDIRFNAVAYLLGKKERLTGNHSAALQEFLDDPANAEGIEWARKSNERYRAKDQAATS